MSKSDTPETDAAQIREAEKRWGVEPQVWPLVPADFARRLERQRNELAEALRDACPAPGVDPKVWWERARALLARIEEGKQ